MISRTYHKNKDTVCPSLTPISKSFIRVKEKELHRYRTRRSPMTICVVAVGKHNNEELFVFATDHMIDVGIGQFEHDIRKHKKINGKTVAMLAGNALLFNELMSDIEKNSKFSDIKQKIYKNFVKVRKGFIKRELLDKYGLTEADITELVKQEIKNPFINTLLKHIAEYSVGTGILLIGYEDGKTQICEINENGTADFSDIHFHAIGSGQIQAINTLLFQRQSKNNDLKKTLYNVCKAKRNAEVVTGVGRETDMLILTKSKCYEMDDKDIKKLEKIYDDELKYGINSSELDELNIITKVG